MLLAAALPLRGLAVELIIDPHSQRGLYWNDPTTIPVQDTPVQFTTNNGTPLWVLQPGSNLTAYSVSDFNITPTVRPSGAYQWTNSIRGLVMGPTGTVDSDLQFTINSINEYGGVYRTSGQDWINLYMGQRISNPGDGYPVGFDANNTSPWLSEISKVLWSMDLNLTTASNRYTTGYNSSVNAAQYNVWLTVQNLATNPDGSRKPGYGDYIWFGMQLYDDRTSLPGQSVMPDPGTGKLIYNIGISNFTKTGLQVGQWQTLKGDLYPYITNALKTAWTWSQTHPGQSNYLSYSTNYGDYKFGGIIHGWEVSGLSIVNLQTRNLSVQAYGVNFPEPNEYYDYFNRANTVAQKTNSSPNWIGSPWAVASGTWAITNYQLVQASGTLTGDQTIYVNTNTVRTLNSGSGTNFNIQSTVKLNTANGESTAWAGLLFNFQNASNYYALRYNGAGMVQVYKSVNGSVSAPLNVTGFSPVQNRPYTLTVSSVAPYHFAVGIYDTVLGTTIYTNASVVDSGNSFQDGYGGLYASANTGVMSYDNFILTVAVWAPPTVLVQPVAASSNYLGCSLTLAPGMGGTPTPQFQWKFNGVSIPNATNANLVLNNLQPTDAGSYVLYATNALGWTNTAAAGVSLSAARATDDYNRSDTGAQTSSSSPNLIGSHWTIASGTWAISSNQLAQAAGALANDQSIYLNALQTLNSGAGTNFIIQATVQLNTGADTAWAGLVFNQQDAWDFYALRYNGVGMVQLIGFAGAPWAILSVTGFTPVQNRPYTLTVSSAGAYNFSVGIFDTVAGTTVYTNALVVDSDHVFQDGYGGLYASANANVMSYDNFSLTVVSIVQAPPIVVVQPAASSNYLGCALTLAPVIDGWPTPQFQWKFNGVDIPDATDQALTLNNLQPTNAGSYVLYATNSLGWTNTVAAVVSLAAGSATDDFNRADTGSQNPSSSPNLIGAHWTIANGTWAISSGQLVQPGGGLVGPQCIYLNTLQTLDPGASTNFTIQATVQLNTPITEGSSSAGLMFNFQDPNNFYALRYFGNGTVQFYRMYHGGEAAMASGSFTPVQNRPYRLTVSSIAPDTFSLGIYDPVAAATVYTNASVAGGVSFLNGYGGLYASYPSAVMSYDNFSLTIVAKAWTPPAIVVQPVASSNYLGCSLTLAPVVDGFPAPQFQWKVGGVSIPNATNQTLTLNNLQPTNAGSYVLYATNALGWTNTMAAVVSLATGSATDDFNRADTGAQTPSSSPNLIGSQWTIANGTWAINNNKLSQAGGTAGGSQCIYLNTLKTSNSSAGTNFTVQATVQLNTPYGDLYTWAGIIFNFQDLNNYYGFRYDGAGYVQLYRMLNGSESAPLNVTGFTLVQNRPYTLTVSSIVPGTFSVIIYDTVAATTIYANASVACGGSPLQDGYGGLYASVNSGVMTYENFTVTHAPAQSDYNRLSPPLPVGGATTVLGFAGSPGFPYALDWATNLATPIAWLPVSTNTANINGWVSFTNNSAAQASYFRTRRP